MPMSFWFPKKDRRTGKWHFYAVAFPVYLAMAVLVLLVSIILAMYGGPAEPPDAPGSASAPPPPLPRLEILIENKRYGGGSNCRGTFAPTGRMRCGYPGAVSEVSWESIDSESRSKQPQYRFTRIFPVGAEDARTTTTTVTLDPEALPTILFEDDEQRVSVIHALPKEEVETIH